MSSFRVSIVCSGFGCTLLELVASAEIQEGSGSSPDDGDDEECPPDGHELGETPRGGERQQHDRHVAGERSTAEHAARAPDLGDLFLEFDLRQVELVAEQGTHVGA